MRQKSKNRLLEIQIKEPISIKPKQKKNMTEERGSELAKSNSIKTKRQSSVGSTQKENDNIDTNDNVEGGPTIIEEVPDEEYSDSDVEQRLSISNEEELRYRVPINLLIAAKNISK